jgi:hypothetical protein
MYYSFEDLDVWKRAANVAVRLYGVLRGCAEGAERDSKRDFVRFLRISKGSAAELRTQLHIASAAGVVNATPCGKIKAEATEISRMLQGLIAGLTRRAKAPKQL